MKNFRSLLFLLTFFLGTVSASAQIEKKVYKGVPSQLSPTFIKAEKEWANNNIYGAIKLYKSVLKKEPYNVGALYRLGLVEIFNENYPKAYSHLNKAHMAEPDNTFILVALTVLHSRAYKDTDIDLYRELSIETWLKLHEIEPLEVEHLAVLAEFYSQLEDQDGAFWALDKMDSLVGISPETLEARLAFFDSTDVVSPRALLTKAVNQDVNNEVFAAMLVDHILTQGDTAAALSALDSLIPTHTDHSTVLMHYLKLLPKHRPSEYQKWCVTTLELATLMEEDAITILEDMAKADSTIEDSKIVAKVKEEYLRQVASFDMLYKDSPDWLVFLANHYVDMGLKDSAISLYQVAAEEAEYPFWLNDAVKLAVELQDTAAAIAFTSTYMDDIAREEEELLLGIWAYHQVGAFKKATIHGRRAEQSFLASNGKKPELLDLIAQSYFGLGQSAKGVQYFQRMIRLEVQVSGNPSWERMNSMAATMANANYKLSLALETIETCNEHYPDNVEVLKTYALVLFMNGDVEKANEIVESALVLQPENAELQELLQKINQPETTEEATED